MSTIEFDFDTLEGQTLQIHATVDDRKVYFKAFNGEKRVSKASLSYNDIINIEDFARSNCEEDLEYESDFYTRQGE